ncbi:carbamoyltransferase HypF [Tumidithrix helvetica PCC 7403]|uniref:carbamoyltransferase HypF n=1 Tax=Tumidithrix helvetica TaxID=3457545 RepID=UPI003C9CFB8A
MALDQPIQRLFLQIRGVVQGVGFRPFVYRLATELELRGWVHNSVQGVLIEVEGQREQLEVFRQRLDIEKPPRSQIHHIETTWLDSVGYKEFSIRASDANSANGLGIKSLKSAIVLPDLATCPDCLGEIFNPSDRRDRYPFTNCTNCGPRYSIIKALPYDRRHTTMHDFPMCPACLSEYTDPLCRRFHAQPNACTDCGPQLELWDGNGKVLASGDRAILETAAQIAEGKILAIKGLGGFHLVVDARNRAAVQQLRQRKQRPHKPFALMYPSLAHIRSDCMVSELEENLLRSPEAPIVLLHKQSELKFPCEDVAPRNPYLGVMLPYTPLHHLLMAILQFPIVATSGNLADEPICIDEREALERLGNLADAFLVHNRPIVRPVDDSIVRVMGDRPMVLRRARGYAPLPLPSLMPRGIKGAEGILALGGHLKNAIALGFDGQIFLSQHIGDLETVSAFENFQFVISSLSSIYEFQPKAIACDAHPDYRSSQFAQKLGQQFKIPVIPVQHHYAHVLSCMADDQISPPVLGIAWDGTGYGLDGTIWGGEFLSIAEASWERVAYFRPFPLPGGEKAVKQPRRVALGILWEIFGERLRSLSNSKTLQAFSAQELNAIAVMLSKHLNSPLTSSVGRLFDAIASLLDICQQASFEGQAAMELEFILDKGIESSYEFDILGKVIDWSPAIASILQDLEYQLPVSQISAKFHNTLVETIVAVAQLVGTSQIVLTGGCFQNKYLTERAVQRLRQEGFSPFWHQQVPPNDGGLAVGQTIAVLRDISAL